MGNIRVLACINVMGYIRVLASDKLVKTGAGFMYKRHMHMKADRVSWRAASTILSIWPHAQV